MRILKKILLLTAMLIVAFSFYDCSKDENGGLVFSDGAGNSLSITLFDPASPASLDYEDYVVITTEYNITHSEGVRMWIIPYTDGEKSPGYLYSSSKIYSGSGSRQVGFSIEFDEDIGPVTVDQLEVVMKNPDQSQTLIEKFIEVSYSFGE